LISRTRASAGIDPGRVREGAVGFLTDTTLCIGCKACEVACKQWNQLPADNVGFTGNSYDNTGDLGAETWRHVAFVERVADDEGHRPTSLAAFQSDWLMMSDVCKHCVNAGCMEACPTGAIVRTEFDTVYVQQDVCNGCGYCVPACPFGVLDMSELHSTARKCTLCYDRLKGGFEPACAKACPTDSIQFGLVDDLVESARQRVADLHDRGVANAYVYGDVLTGGTGGISGLNASFILTAPPETYNLPDQPELPQDKSIPGYATTLLAGVLMAVAAALSLRSRS
jgi:formate dehydrogenase iron-sulfur subunit